MIKILFILELQQPLKPDFPSKLHARFPEHQFSFILFGVATSSTNLTTQINPENNVALQTAIEQANQIWAYSPNSSSLEPHLLAILVAATLNDKPTRLVQKLDPFTFAEENDKSTWWQTSQKLTANLPRVLLQQTSLIARQQKELTLRKQQLENLIRQVSSAQSGPSTFTNRFHRWRIKIIPEDSRIEVLYYRLRDTLYRAAHFIKRRLNTKRRSAKQRLHLTIPEWWTNTNEDNPIYDLLDSFWLQHANTPAHAIILSAVPPDQKSHRSVQLAHQLSQTGTAVIYAYYRFDPSDNNYHIGQSLETGIFEIPIDMLWANPARVFHSPYAPQNSPALFIEFPHPLLFRIINLANASHWISIYNAPENWQDLQNQGLADWYNPKFETYLLNNVRYKGERAFDEIQEQETSTTLEEDHAPSPIPEWWKNAPLDQTLLENLENFCQQQAQAKGCVVLFSGVLFTRSEGQRATWLTRALVKMGIPVIFAYFRFAGQEKQAQDADFPLVFQIPIDQLWAFPIPYLNLLQQIGKQRHFIAEFPHPALIRLLNLFRSHDFVTIYETIDDWAEFHRVGQAEWYTPAVERYVLANVDALTATAETLAEHMATLSGRAVQFLPNAFEKGSLSPSNTPRSLPRGQMLTIGYFGHLTSSWFDWPMLIQTAQTHPEWTFHIIGYGYDNPIPLPDNILLLGKVAHEELPHYAANWNVAIIPFKVTRLSGGVNPIKVYEYLQLRLPVVACGMPHLTRFPYVQNAQNGHEFEISIQKAAQTHLDEQILEKFLEQNTWQHRAAQLLSMKPSSQA
jgi:hypothetical protein